MSDMYAIKTSTLTAIGDAVRSKQGVSPKSVDICFESSGTLNYTFTNSGSAHSYRYIINATLSNQSAPRQFVIRENDINGTTLFQDSVPDGESTIIVETTSPVIYLFYALSSYNTNKLECNITAIPLDENGNEYKYKPLEMAEQINELLTIPASGLVISGNCNNRFVHGGWDWFIQAYGNKITTKDITALTGMFNYSQLTEIPFDINVSGNCSGLDNIFSSMSNLIQLPLIKGNFNPPTGNYSGNPSMGSFFYNLYQVREIPYDYLDNFGGEEFWAATQQYQALRSSLVQNCFSLRKLPNLTKAMNLNTSSYSHFYYGFCSGCYALDEIVNIPVSKATLTSNCFSSFSRDCYRVKDIVFQTNEDGTAITANWKSQTIDLSGYLGYLSNGYQSNLTRSYNSGITDDKAVNDDATYQALKNDPDWFAINIAYSRYNHDSAVNTINSLPDTSAYGTNTIKLQGTAGSKTDGGAINTLTEAEIAVAAAKGWTVSLV